VERKKKAIRGVRTIRDGLHDIDFTHRHPDGRRERIRERFSGTRRLAEQHKLQIQEQLIAGTYKAPSKVTPTVDAFADQFLEVYAATNNKLSEVQSKRTIVERHIKPAFGPRRIDQIGVAEIEQFKSAKVAAGLKAKTINNLLTVLGTMLTEAAEWGLIDKAPRIKWMRVTPAGFDFLTFEEAEQVLEAADAGMWRVMILTGLRAGLRMGELLGLDRGAVDFEAGIISVRGNYVRGELGTPKSHRPREVPMSPQLRAELRAWLGTHDHGPVFHLEGKRVEKGQAKWPLWRACKRAGVRRIGWHVLRHTFASHLVMRGVPLITVRDLMGHTTIQMTERYAHLAPDLRTEAVAILDHADRRRLVDANTSESKGMH
jgi:integrase